MKFALVKSGNLEGYKNIFITDLSFIIEKYLADKNYGTSIMDFLIGVVCVKPEFEKFFKVKRPKYTEDEIETHDGHSVHIKSTFSMNFIMDHEKVIDMTDSVFEKYLIERIVDSVLSLEKMPKKVVDFDLVRFKDDMKRFRQECSSTN